MVSDGDRLRSRVRGTWYCRCGELAIVERESPKCDVCKRGESCGSDCTVSKLYCTKCGAVA
jgi:hypothetical protein